MYAYICAHAAAPPRDRAPYADIDRSVIKPAPQRSAKGVVVLDPGHGRGDPGATHYLPDGSGRWDITEADSNLRNAELIRDNLQVMGYDVYLTREGDGHGPGAPLPLQFIASDLYARVALARAVEADVYLAIHGNGASVKSISGPETWYCGMHEEGAANEDLARRVQQANAVARRQRLDPPRQRIASRPDRPRTDSQLRRRSRDRRRNGARGRPAPRLHDRRLRASPRRRARQTHGVRIRRRPPRRGGRGANPRMVAPDAKLAARRGS